MTLSGPSRTIVVEPLEIPAEEPRRGEPSPPPAPAPPPAPMPEPAPA